MTGGPDPEDMQRDLALEVHRLSCCDHRRTVPST